MSAGFQAGLQDYSQLLVFENQAAMDKLYIASYVIAHN